MDHTHISSVQFGNRVNPNQGLVRFIMNLAKQSVFAAMTSVAMLTGVSIVATGCGEADAVVNYDEQDVTTLVFNVNGMHCEGCVGSVRNAIAKLDGVYSCEVSLAEGSAVVKARDTTVSPAILNAVASLDFTIEQAHTEAPQQTP
jgi:copper chaperone